MCFPILSLCLNMAEEPIGAHIPVSIKKLEDLLWTIPPCFQNIPELYNMATPGVLKGKIEEAMVDLAPEICHLT